MGVAQRREREREDLRRRILEAARELFADEGYERVTMRRIAEVIEYSPTTLYNHFADKATLVDALCEQDFGRLLSVFSDRPVPQDPVEAIRQIGRGYAAFGLANPHQYRFMFMTPLEEKAPEGHGLSPSGLGAFAFLKDAVQKAIDAGRFRADDPQAMAQTLWACMHGVVALLITYKPHQFPEGAAAPDLVERVVEAGIRGMLADAPSPAPRSRKKA